MDMMSGNLHKVHEYVSGLIEGKQAISSTRSPHIAQVAGVSRVFISGEGNEFFALHDVSLEVPLGTSVALVGSSGSGKSTLLNLLAGLDRPTGGGVCVAGTELVGRSEDELARHRGKHVGVVFQFFQLLPTLTALENVVLPMQLLGQMPAHERRRRALELLDDFGIADQANKLPLTLSGGQQQRVAIARALANDPPLLVADEPTGNLDSHTAEQVLALLIDLPRRGKTLIMATHETRLLHRFDRIVTLKDGRIVDDTARKDHMAPSLSGADSCSV